jgi:serine/threonine-protein kinase RsbT
MTHDSYEIAKRLPLRDDSDVAAASRHSRQLARAHGLARASTEALATAVTEVARNALVHAGGGDMLLGVLRTGERVAIVVVARDDGPGIVNIDEAMLDGHSTGDTLGLGLPSARRLVDDFEISSSADGGTTVTLKQWCR